MGTRPRAGLAEVHDAVALDGWLILVWWMGYSSALLMSGGTLFHVIVLRPGLAALRPQDAVRLERIAAAWLRRLTLVGGLMLLLSIAPEVLVQATPPGAASSPGLMADAHGSGTRSGWTALLRLGLGALLLLRPVPRVRLMQAAAVTWLAIVIVLILVVGGPPPVGSVQFMYVVLPSVVYGMIAALGVLILPQVPDVHLPDLSWAPAATAVSLVLAFALASSALDRGALAIAAETARMLAAAFWIGGPAVLLGVFLGEGPAHRVHAAGHLMPRVSVVAGVTLVVLVGPTIPLAWLPTLNAGLNALSAVLVTAAYRAIRAKQVERHRRLMLSALSVSALFLASYLYYHAHAGATRFAGTGASRPVYFTILASHTVLAAAIVPLVGVTLYRALRGRFALHRRIARITLPLWLYVSVTGVLVYLMLYHLYPSR